MNDEMVDTWIEVRYPAPAGSIGLRGSHAPLSWTETLAPVRTSGEDHLFCIPIRAGELVDLKVVHGEDWARGRNYQVHAGDHLRLEPSFGDGANRFIENIVVTRGEQTARVDVLLPPSYGEQTSKRYPVLYMLDGQSLWTHSNDPFGTWSMDRTLEMLHDLGVIDEIIVVGIHTADDRLAVLSPVADARYGGGQGDAFLDLLVDGIRPEIDARFRTIAKREATAILGSSMGGLFAFYAAWTRPEIFGKAACLSSSFWWADRWAVRHVQSSTPPALRPFLYLDSGASPNPTEEDARLLDGFHHTRSMMRALERVGFDVKTGVNRLVFPGERHHAEAWASRVALPLQLLFPYVMQSLEAPESAQNQAA